MIIVNSYISFISGDPNYSNVILLLHADNSLTDNSSNNATLTQTSLTYSTSIFKFGTASFSINSTTIATPTSANYNFGTDNFTIEFWVYFNGTYNTGDQGFMLSILGNGNNNSTWGSDRWYIGADQGSSYIGFISYNQTNTMVYTTTAYTRFVWTHFAFVRNGAALLLFYNGQLQTTSASYFSTTSNLDIGPTNRITMGTSDISGTSAFLGYLDDIRITKGIARYTSNFSVPVKAFPNS